MFKRVLTCLAQWRQELFLVKAVKIRMNRFGVISGIHAKGRLIGKDSDAGKDWGQEEKGTIEDEKVGWHHRLNGHEFEQAPGDSKGQGSLGCWSPWGHKESDNDLATEQHSSSLQAKGIGRLCPVRKSWPSNLYWEIKRACECIRHPRDAVALYFHNEVLRTARRSNQSILKEISPGISLEGMMLKLKLQYFGHLTRRVDSLEKTLMLGGIGGQEEKGTTEDEMAGWHHRLDGRESEWTPGGGDEQRGLACCYSWGHKESHTTEWLNWTRNQKTQQTNK